MSPSSSQLEREPRLRPLARQSLAEQIMAQLLAFISSAGMQEGELVPSQHDLARRLSVSRPVLREAMQGLAAVGVIEIRPGSGCYVRDPRGTLPPASLFEEMAHVSALEILEARLVVEVELAALAAARATAADIEVMQAILRPSKRTVTRQASTSPVTSDFHMALAKAAHNGALYQVSQLLRCRSRAQGTRIELALPDVPAGEHTSHLALLDAVRTGNPSIARAEMQTHLEQAHGWEEQVAAARLLSATATSPAGRDQSSAAG